MEENRAEPLRLTLQDIVGWGHTDAKNRVSIPALQRGLVWRPKQIELLWDSLMRGIPIGSFVVCKEIESQRKQVGETADYHLLDGQQRSNAIQLGFDAFSSEKDIQNPKKSILWLDIAPQDLPKESSRNFLFRVTTPAHPWGYTKADEEGRLDVGTIQSGLERLSWKEPSDKTYKRPRPEEIQPIEANVPVPFSLLMGAFENGSLNRTTLIERIRVCKGTWVEKALETLKTCDLTAISEGLAIARSTTVLALLAPSALLMPSQQERDESEREDITNIEHLFQRLNQQGTRLDGEELIYSLIKAYWPKIVSRIDDISKTCMPSSRLISLAFRVIRTEAGRSGEPLASAPTVSAIRQLAKDESKADLRKTVIDFINSDGADSLKACCKRIDQWLGTNPQTAWGLPPVLRSSIAYKHPEFYLLLLLLARKNVQALDEDCCRLLTGVITYGTWFWKDKSLITRALYQGLKGGITLTTLRNAARSACEGFLPLHTPEAVDAFMKIPEPSDEAFATWNWWTLMVDADEAVSLERHDNWWEFLGIVRGHRDFLLYAQRAFIKERFADYDPARKDLWEDHNRPWDFDHILPQKMIKGMKSGNQCLNFCQHQWLNTIGNLRAWPFEDNRSDQATKAGDKLNEELMDKSFILKDELSGFDQDRNVIATAENAHAFAMSCKHRIIRIYKAWFDQLLLGELLQKD